MGGVKPHPDEARQRGEGEPLDGEAEGRAHRVPSGQNRTQRVFRSACMSWSPKEWGEDSPWMKLFRNAREWVG